MFAFLLSGSENTPLLPGPFILSISEQTWDINTYKYWGFFSSAEWVVIKKEAKKLFLFAKAENQLTGFRSRLQPPVEKGQGHSLYSLKGFLEGPRVRVQLGPWLTSLTEMHTCISGGKSASILTIREGWITALTTTHSPWCKDALERELIALSQTHSRGLEMQQKFWAKKVRFGTQVNHSNRRGRDIEWDGDRVGE